jgi:hypothetical protein
VALVPPPLLFNRHLIIDGRKWKVQRWDRMVLITIVMEMRKNVQMPLGSSRDYL